MCLGYCNYEDDLCYMHELWHLPKRTNVDYSEPQTRKAEQLLTQHLISWQILTNHAFIPCPLNHLCMYSKYVSIHRGERAKKRCPRKTFFPIFSECANVFISQNYAEISMLNFSEYRGIPGDFLHGIPRGNTTDGAKQQGQNSQNRTVRREQ